MKLISITISVLVLLLIQYNKTNTYETIIIDKKSSHYISNWNELVIDSTVVNLSENGIQKDFASVPYIKFLSTGDLVIPNGFNNSIYILSRKGKLKRKINNEGRGPGEIEILASIAIDSKDNIYVYDPSQRKIVVYYAPDYMEFNDYFSKEQISNFTVVNGIEDIVTYSPYTNHLFNKINFKDSDTINSAIKPEDENFKIWLSRIQTGNVVFDQKNEKLYGLYPEDLLIYRFSKDLNIEQKIIPTSQKIFSKKFPSNLDPYDHTLHHERWWAEFSHLRRVMLLEEDKIVVSYYGAGRITDSERNVFINIYDLNEKTIIAENIPLPKNSNLVGINNGDLFISFNATIDDKQNEVPFRLYKFSIEPEKK